MRWAISAALLLFLLAPALHGQIRGIPASVTSLGPRGFHGRMGVPAGVNSLGPAGFASFGCGGPLIPSAMGCTPGITFAGSVDPRLRPHQHIGGQGFVYPYYVPIYDSSYPVVYMEAPPEPQPEEPPAPTIFERRSRVRRYQDVDTREAARPEPEPTPVKAEPPEPPQPQVATVLVFRNGRQLEVHNYAIVGDTVYVFADALSRKLPLADLDVDATTRLNDERGVDFHVPGTRPKPTTVPPVAAPATTLRAGP